MKANFTTQNHYPDHSQWIYYATLGAVLLGMATNLINFCVFWCEPVRRHYLSVGLRLLSANDFFLLLLYFVLSHTSLHNWSQYTCFLTNYLYGLVTMMSPWLLVVITIDRVLFLSSQGMSSHVRNPHRVCILIKLVVAGSLGWNLHCRWTVGFGEYLGYNETKICVPTATMQTHAFQLADSLIVSFLPGLILLLLNCAILHKVRRLVRTIARGCRAVNEHQRCLEMNSVNAMQTPVTSANEVFQRSGSETRPSLVETFQASSDDQYELRKHQCQITRMLLGFCFVYLAFNLPNYIALVMGQLMFVSLDASRQTMYAYYNMLRLVAQLLYMLHFSTNSLIYAYANKLFRVALIRFVGSIGSCLLCYCCRHH